MLIRSLTVLLFAGVAFAATAATDDAEKKKKDKKEKEEKSNQERATAVQTEAVRAAQQKRALVGFLVRAAAMATKLEEGNEADKENAKALRKSLKVLSESNTEGKVESLLRNLIRKNAHQDLDVLSQAIVDSREFSDDLRRLHRVLVRECRPPRFDAAALFRELAALKAALDRDDGKIHKELKAYVRKERKSRPPEHDLGELLDEVLGGGSGEGKAGRDGDGKGRPGQTANAGQAKPGGGKVTSLKKDGDDYPALTDGKGPLDFGLLESSGVYVSLLRGVAGELQGKQRLACEDLARRLEEVVRMRARSLQALLDDLGERVEAQDKIGRRLMKIRQDYIDELLKD